MFRDNKRKQRFPWDIQESVQVHIIDASCIHEQHHVPRKQTKATCFLEFRLWYTTKGITRRSLISIVDVVYDATNIL